MHACYVVCKIYNLIPFSGNNYGTQCYSKRSVISPKWAKSSKPEASLILLICACVTKLITMVAGYSIIGIRNTEGNANDYAAKESIYSPFAVQILCASVE